MGLGTSLLLIAAGAILRFAVTVTVHGLNIRTVGVILMVVGVVGLLISILWLGMIAERRRRVAPAAAADARYPRGPEPY